MGKRKKTGFIIEPSPLMRISEDVVDPNKQNLEKAGLWEFICAEWPMANPERVLAYLLGSSRGAQEEFRIQGQIVHFDVNTISRHFPGLPTSGPTLVAAKLLGKVEFIEVFERPVDAKVEAGYVIGKAKPHWQEWFKYVNLRLLMAPQGAEVITSEGLAAAYRSWNGETLNWVKILFNQIRMEIAGKATRNRLFFHSSTYLSEFCPVLQEQAQVNETEDAGETFKVKRRRYITSSQEECEDEEGPGVLDASRRSTPELPWIPVIVTPEHASTEDEGQTLVELPPDPPLIRKKSQLSSTKQVGNTLPLIKRSMIIDMTAQMGRKEESVKSRSKTNHKGSPSKLASTKQITRKQGPDEALQERESLELLVTQKDDLVAQYQVSIKEILAAKDAVEKQLRHEKEELLMELKKVTTDAANWKIHYTNQLPNIQRYEELSVQVSKLTHELEEAMQRLKNQNVMYNLEKENGMKLARELASSVQQHARELYEAKFNNPISNLITQTDASVVASLEQNVKTLAEANAKLQTQLTIEQGSKLKLQDSLWVQQLKAPPSFSLFREYELQREAFYTITNLNRGAVLSDEEFDWVWSSANHFANMQNLICEMVARADLVLATPNKLMIPIGDLGARVLLYYLTLEGQLEYKRSIEQPTESYRHVRLPVTLVASSTNMLEWTKVLEHLAQGLQDDPTFLEALTLVSVQEDVAQRGELSSAHYVYARARAVKRIHCSLEGVKNAVINTEEYLLQARLSLPPHEFKPPTGMKMLAPVIGSFLKQRYLGHYDQMFMDEAEKPFPTWQAIEWILEDVGLSRMHWRQWDNLYPRLSQNWSNTVPLMVATNPHLCPLKRARRYKWAPWSKLDSLPYNWPQVPGSFATYHECAESYRAFFEAHRTHTDPVCFRAAVFCNFLAYACIQYKMVLNVNRYDETKPKFYLWLKLQQKPARWTRLLECMVITNFLNGPSSVFALEFSNKRQDHINFWLRYQQTHDTYLLTHDEDVSRNLAELDLQAFAQELELQDEFKNKKPKVELKRRI